MNKKSVSERAKIIQLLVEGNSLRSTSRIADCSINTVTKILEEVGEKCAEYQDKHLVNLPCKAVQVDEIWSYVYARNYGEKTTENTSVDGYAGDCWTWTALCPDTKLIVCWYVGPRDKNSATEFIGDLASRLKDRIQLTSDGFTAYKDATEAAFGPNVDFARLVKQYGDTKGKKFSPCTGAIKERVIGKPDMSKITTAHVERQNMTMRMSIRRFGRKTNAFSKKLENHCHAIAIHFLYYNYCRIHKTLRVTPAMQAGLTDHVWSLEELVNLD